MPANELLWGLMLVKKQDAKGDEELQWHLNWGKYELFTLCTCGQISWCYLQLQHCWQYIVQIPAWVIPSEFLDEAGHTCCSCFQHQPNEVWMKSCSSHVLYLLVSFGGFCNSWGELDKIPSQSHSFHSDHKTQIFPPNRAVLVGLATRHSECYTARRPWNN